MNGSKFKHRNFMENLIYILIGVFAGFTSGLFGIGGGVISVPCLFFAFTLFNPSHPMIMHLAIGTSLAAMVFSSLSSYISHYRKKNVYFFLVKYLTIGGILGGFVGPLLALVINETILQCIFGVFLLYSAFHFLKSKEKHYDSYPTGHPSKTLLGFCGFFISTFSSLLGIGGGFFTMPLLSKLKYPLNTCVGTSAAMSFIITCFGSIAYVVVGYLDQTHEGFTEFINIRAFIFVSIMGVIFAPLGVKALHRLHPKKTKQSFGLVLGLVGLYMILRSPFFLDIIK